MQCCCFSVCRLVTSFQSPIMPSYQPASAENSAHICFWCRSEAGELLPCQHSPPGTGLQLLLGCFFPRLPSLAHLLGSEFPWSSSIMGGPWLHQGTAGGLQHSEGPCLWTARPLRSQWGAPPAGWMGPTVVRLLAGRLRTSMGFYVFAGGTMKGTGLKIIPSTASGHEPASASFA